MLKPLVVLSALVIGSATMAQAASITGGFSAANTPTGGDTFTSSTINFGPAAVGGTITGTFASYLTDGDPVTFPTGNLPYSVGTHTPPGGSIAILSTTGMGETFTFVMTGYSAAYGAVPGCVAGGVCLDITGTGYFDASGDWSGTSGAANFVFTTQYAEGFASPETTTFSASGSVVPEPSSLALLGTGLLGAVGIARRKYGV